MVKSNQSHISRSPRQYLQWGSLGTSGGAIVLLVTALNMIGQQGDQIGMLQVTVNQMSRDSLAEHTSTDLRMVRIQHQLEQAKADIARLQLLESDPDARPNAWTKSADDARMEAFEERMLDLMRLERERWVGSEPLHLQQLLDIQRAIASLPGPSEAPDAWTRDGKPRAQAVADRYGGNVTETERDRAWILLETARQAARTLRR